MPIEEQLFDDALDGKLDQFSLFDAALVASGVDDLDTLRHYRQRLSDAADELCRSGKVQGEPREQARTVFEFLHRRILTSGYKLQSTDLRQALDHGQFNCVSASVLFNCLAGEFGLPVCALELPGHAMSRVRLPGGPLDIETTCPRWFALTAGGQKQAVARVALRSAKGDHTAREVSDVELLAMIYYNRGVDLLAEKRFAEAVAANAKAVRLDPSNATARGNLLASINNWAIALGAVGQYAEAAALLRQGMALDANYEIFTLNYVHLYRQWIEGLCAVGRFAEAARLLAEAAAERPAEGYFRQAQAEVERRRADWGREATTTTHAPAAPLPVRAAAPTPPGARGA